MNAYRVQDKTGNFFLVTAGDSIRALTLVDESLTCKRIQGEYVAKLV